MKYEEVLAYEAEIDDVAQLLVIFHDDPLIIENVADVLFKAYEAVVEYDDDIANNT